MKQFTKCQLKGVGVTALFVIMILLFTSLLSPVLVSSHGLSTYKDTNSKYPKKPHEHKITELKASKDPFKFPMPLGELDTNAVDSVDSNLKSKDQPSDDSTWSGTGTALKHSTFKATIVPEKKMIKNVTDNTSKATTYITRKSDTKSDNVSLAYNKNISIPISDNKNGSKLYNLDVHGKVIPIKYQITGLSNKLLNMSLKNDNATLLIQLSSSSPGTLRIELARNIIDSKNQDMHTDSPFAVFEDGLYTSFEETENNNYVRQVIMQLHKGTGQIAIVGTHASPEYGSTTAVLYGISMTVIIIIIVVARYNRLSFTSLGRP
ncbi:MAG: hypothetical protein ACJ704_13805 [Nitrososphaeraceae archaeon]